MTNQIDALLVRSLPELEEAALAIEPLSERIGVELDNEIRGWIRNNGWIGVSEFMDNDEVWLAPPEWIIAGETDKAHLYFDFHATPEGSSYWLSTLLGCAKDTYGFWLEQNSVKKIEFKRLWRDHSTVSQLPLSGSEFFLPLIVDRELLASSIENNTIVDALGSIRDTLDRLPQLVSQLEPLKRAIEAAAIKKAG